MYNPELKERFIAEATQSEHTALVYRRIFEITEAFEEKLQKDICEMDSQSGRPLADAITNVSGESIEKRLSLVKQYVRWCVRNGVPGATDSFLGVVPNPFSQIRKRMVSGPIMMRDYLNLVFDWPGELTVHNVFRCLMWLGFMGVAADRAYTLSANDVDLERRIVRVDDMICEIPDEAMPEFRNCVMQTGFFRVVNRGKTAQMTPRASGNLLLRSLVEGANPENIKIRISINQRAAEESGKTDKRLSYEHARLSGFFYRMFQREMAGEPVDFREIAERLEEESARLKPGNKADDKSAKLRIAARDRGLCADYRRWKIAFTS